MKPGKVCVVNNFLHCSSGDSTIYTDFFSCTWNLIFFGGGASAAYLSNCLLLQIIPTAAQRIRNTAGSEGSNLDRSHLWSILITWKKKSQRTECIRKVTKRKMWTAAFMVPRDLAEQLYRVSSTLTPETWNSFWVIMCVCVCVYESVAYWCQSCV